MTRRTKKYLLRKKRGIVWQWIGKPTGMKYGDYTVHMIPPRINLWTGEYENGSDRYTRELLIKGPYNDPNI